MSDRNKARFLSLPGHARLRRLAVDTQEGPPHPFAVGKACPSRDAVDTVGARLEVRARRLRPNAFDRLGGRFAGLGLEAAQELARADQPRRPDARRSAPRQDSRGCAPARRGCVRCRAPGPAAPRTATGRPSGGGDHHLARRGARHLRAQVGFDHRQREVYAGGNAGRGPRIAIADVDPVGVDSHVRMVARELGGMTPVSGGAPPVEQARGRQHECARADAGQAPAGLAMRVQIPAHGRGDGGRARASPPGTTSVPEGASRQDRVRTSTRKNSAPGRHAPTRREPHRPDRRRCAPACRRSGTPRRGQTYPAVEVRHQQEDDVVWHGDFEGIMSFTPEFASIQ